MTYPEYDIKKRIYPVIQKSKINCEWKDLDLGLFLHKNKDTNTCIISPLYNFMHYIIFAMIVLCPGMFLHLALKEKEKKL